MKSETEIATRINELKENIKIIKEKTREELNKKYYKRDDRLLKFLNKEQCVWEFALLQIEWIFSDR